MSEIGSPAKTVIFDGGKSERTSLAKTEACGDEPSGRVSIGGGTRVDRGDRKGG